MWCPQCKAEYRPGIAECADCFAALVPDLPLENANWHETVNYDLSDWQADRRAVAQARLLAAGAHVLWELGTLIVDAPHETDADRIIDEVDELRGDELTSSDVELPLDMPRNATFHRES